ncbi:pol [Symbiodinium pilosum]|uniref:Pol protein n=1 Tax=Symbiodinium pilosum TaxID=2952 RepID=A0A812PI51_SYMPI|nr:pol [Symbiodinium pilosum]
MALIAAQAEAQMQEVFRAVLGTAGKRAQTTLLDEADSRPDKHNRPNGKGGAGRGAGSHGWRANRTSKRATVKNMENEEVGADELLKLLCRVVIRQEDTLNILKQSTSWVIFARTETPSVIPGLVMASQKWKEEITKPNSQLSGVSLHTTLLWCLLNQVMEILKNVTEEQMKKAKESGWCTEQGQWVYQKWSPANQALEQDVARVPLQTSAMMKLVEDLKALTTAEIVTAFHSKRPLTPNMQGAMVVLQLGVNFRKPEANKFYDLLEQLMGQASLQMGGLQIRKEGYKRSAAVSKLDDAVGGGHRSKDGDFAYEYWS